MKSSVPVVQIIYEDQHFFVLNKPAGLVVDHSVSSRAKTLQDWLAVKNQTKVFRDGIVHRLDKETSGLLLAAKTTAMVKKLQQLFKNRRIKKRYLALVHGEVRPVKGEIRAPISRSSFNRQKFGVFPGGRESVTQYRVVENFKEGYCLLELRPLTGRTHQIRVHLKHLGHPIVGDAKYGGRKTVRTDRGWCPRQFLHASYLGFDHPVSGQSVEFESPLPNDLKKALAALVSKR